MTKKKSAIKKKHRRMMEKRAENEQKIQLEKDREIHGGKMTIDELVYKTLHPYD